MKKSISIWSFYGQHDLRGKLVLAKKAGFAGFEIDLSEDGPVNIKSSPGDLVAVRRMADEVGLVLSGLATGLYWQANAASANLEIRRRAARILDKQLDCAHALGIDAILVVPGAVGGEFVEGDEVVPYDLALERAKKFICDAVPKAESLKITIGIENVWNMAMLSPLEVRNFIDGIGSDFVKAYFDVGNVLANGYPEHWIRILGHRITRVHFKDYRRAVGSMHGFIDLLSGDVNWPAVMSELHAAGYDGWCAAEMIPPVPFYRYAPDTLIYNTSKAMDAIFAKVADNGGRGDD